MTRIRQEPPSLDKMTRSIKFEASTAYISSKEAEQGLFHRSGTRNSFLYDAYVANHEYGVTGAYLKLSCENRIRYQIGIAAGRLFLRLYGDG